MKIDIDRYWLNIYTRKWWNLEKDLDDYQFQQDGVPGQNENLTIQFLQQKFS